MIRKTSLVPEDSFVLHWRYKASIANAPKIFSFSEAHAEIFTQLKNVVYTCIVCHLTYSCVKHYIKVVNNIRLC